MTVTVPWNAAWTGEAGCEVRPCRYAGGRLAVWQPFKPGVGRPLFALPHVVRQRKSIAEMRCTVCGHRTQPDDRWHFALGDECTLSNGDPGLMTTEAPVHKACADLALSLCPRLKALRATPLPFPRAYDIACAFVGGPAVARDFGLTINPAQPVVGSLKLLIARFNP